jgi:dienelactone hydrolase
MATILLFHSVLGLRDGEAALAARFRAAGHEVVLPDLYGGQRSNDYDRGFAIRDRVGWGTMIARAQAAAAPLPPETVLAGVSLGAQVAGEVWAGRPEAAGVLLLHGPCEIPPDARPGLPVQAHLAEPEPFDDESFIADWAEGAHEARVAFELYRYPGAGHYFTDASLPDHDAAAARLAVDRALELLAAL